MGLPITPFNPQQPDVLGTYARLAQIKNAQQEGRLQQQQQAENDLNLQKQKMAVQQQQQGQQDEQIWNAAQRQANGDPVKTRAYAIGAGASQPSVENFDTSVAKLKDTLSEQTSRDLTNLDKQHQNLRDEFSAVLKLPPTEQPAAYAAKVAELQADPARAASLYGIPDVTKLPPFPGTQALQAQADGLAGQHTLVAEAKDAATTRESNAKAALDEAKKTLSANPQDLNATIDGVADPTKYADLNKRLKFQMGFAQRNLAADPDGPAKVIAAGMQEVGTTERETDPKILAARQTQNAAVEKTRQEVNSTFQNNKDARDKIEQNVLKPYQEKISQINDLNSAVEQAQSGNIAAARATLYKVIGVAQPQGTHRVAPTEVSGFSGMGNYSQRIQGSIANALSGDPWTPQMVQDIKSFGAAQGASATKTLNDGIDNVNKLYGTSVGSALKQGSAPASTGHVIAIGNKQYQYKGTGDTADLKNYTEVTAK